MRLEHAVQVLLVDDHPVILEVLQAVVNRVLAPTAVYAAKELEAALRQARCLSQRDLVVLDLGLPRCSRTEALLRFRSHFPKLRVVVVSAIEEGTVIRAAIAAGAKAYIPKSSSVSVMQSAFQVVAAGGVYLPPQALTVDPPEKPSPSALAPQVDPPPPLSGRQFEVLRRIAKGLHNRQIACELDISENTVKHHAHEIFRTLGVSTRTEALVAAIRYGLRLD